MVVIHTAKGLAGDTDGQETPCAMSPRFTVPRERSQMQKHHTLPFMGNSGAGETALR